MCFNSFSTQNNLVNKIKTIIGPIFDEKTKVQLCNLVKFKVTEQVFKPG